MYSQDSGGQNSDEFLSKLEPNLVIILGDSIRPIY